jgi:hypothetical protein
MLALALLGTGVWFAPDLVVHTPLRDRPLAMAFAGIDGSIASGGATWRWVGGVEYRDVVLRDRSGRPALVVARLLLDRGIARMVFDRRNLGTVRFIDPEALVEVRGDGSSLEDVLAPWLATAGSAPAMEIEVVNGTVEFVDVARRDAWRVSDVIAAGTLLGDGGVAGWTAAGRLRHSAGGTQGPATPPPVTDATVRLERATIPTAAAAVLVRDGGWSISSPPVAADGSRTVTVAGHRVPLGFSSVVASRFGLPQLVDGIADIRLDVTDAPGGRRAQGAVTLEQFAVCDSADLAERFTVERCEMPFDVSVSGDRLVVRRLVATAPMVRAELDGCLRLPGADVRGWLERLAGEDFTVSLDVDLAAAAHGLPNGLAVRPDVRVTGGTLRVAAAARADGSDRLLEVRATARDLAATRSLADGAAATAKELAWPEPFTAWVKVRRGPGGQATLRMEEARVVSEAAELAAVGGPEGLGIQWTADVGAIVAGLAEVLDLGVSARGRSRGRLDLATAGSAGGSLATLSADISDLEITAAGLPPWRDDEMTIEAEAAGAITGGLAAVERARGLVACGDDRLEASITGGVLVDLPAVAGIAVTRGVPWIRPAAGAEGVAAECSLSGDLASWLPRLAALAPASVPGGMEASGRVIASAAIAARGDAWHFDRAAAEIEKLSARWRGREIAEPRVIATLAGRIEAASGRVVLSSAELLSATLSLRSGGLAWDPPSAAAMLDRIRGRVQWQADLARFERWLATPDAAGRWPASGRAWGTVEIADTQAGVNVLVEATGSQIALASAAAAGRPLWSEPRPTFVLEVTRPLDSGGRSADALQVDRLAVESSTFELAASGGVNELSSRRVVSLEGTAAYDWEQVSRLLTPWTGGRVRLAGAGGRPFAVRGPLGAPPAVVGGDPAAAGDAAVVPLPSDWLSATRGGDAATELTARLARPVSAAVAATRPAVIRNLAVDTSAAWTAGDLDGIPLAAGEMAVRLLEGQLAFGPFDIPAAGGRLRAAPWIRLEPWPGELIVPPGRVAERLALSGPLCDRWMKWLVPVLGHSTHTSGMVSVDLAGARIPLADSFAGELAGQMLFENLEVTPGGAVQPLVNLLVKLQSVVDPRFAFGDKAVLMRVRPEPVRMRLAGRRFAHDGLVMDAGQLVVKSQGSVGEDGSLDMRLEVALRGDLVGQTPVLGQLFRTPLLVPLKGTVHRPQFDAAAMDKILGRIVENTAEAVIKDGIGRGLEAMFGQPSPSAPAPAAQPAAAAAPIVLPPQR